MNTRNLIFASIGIMMMSTNTNANWGRVQCLSKCTDQSCTDTHQMEECEKNCAHLPGALEACKSALQATPPTKQVRALPSKPETRSEQPLKQNAPNLKRPSSRELMKSSKRHAVIYDSAPLEGVNIPNQGEADNTQGVPRGRSKPAQRPTTAAPDIIAQDSTYTVVELNTLLKNLLNDAFREVTTGCNTAKVQFENGVKMVNHLKGSEAANLTKTGLGWISLTDRETKEAKAWVDSFDITGKISIKDLKEKYKINDFDIKQGKFSLDQIKAIFQKSMEKSLLAAQDCKVKHKEFQRLLDEYYAKQPHS